jgi:lysozyme
VDWSQLKQANIKFAFIKASDGATFADPGFADAWNGATRADIPHGAYHFFRPKKSVQEQVDNFLSAYSSVDAGQLPPALDVENPGKINIFKGLSAKKSVDKVLSWLEAIEEKTGQRPLIYTNSGTVNHILHNDARLAKYPLWFSQPPPSERLTPAPFDKRTFWQYNTHGRVPGISDNVDLDLFNGSSIEYRAFLRSIDTKRADPSRWDR